MQQSQSVGGMGMVVGPRGGGTKKKTGIKSSLGRIFSKKDKAAAARKDLYMAGGGRGELTTDSELRLAAQDGLY